MVTWSLFPFAFHVNEMINLCIIRNCFMAEFIFSQQRPLALLTSRSLNDWSLGKQFILFSSNLKVSAAPPGNIEIRGKQNELLYPCFDMFFLS